MKTSKMILVLVFCFGFVQLCLAQINWDKYENNPVFTDSSAWLLGQKGAYGPSVLIIGSTYHMWYAGYDGTKYPIAYATSLDGISWVPYVNNPVLDVGLQGSYEQTHVIEQCVIYDGSTFHMWYTGVNTTVSPWREAIGYATSQDGMNWTKYSTQPVLDKGPTGSWDDTKVFCPSVIFDGSLFHMWYSGGSTGDIRHTGYTTSPDGFTWTKYANNPVMNAGSYGDWDYPRATQPEVLFDGTRYHMFYGGGRWRGQRIGYATSPDKITWTKNTNNPVLDKGESGSWDDYYVNITSVLIDTADSIFRMWYSGCRNPDSNLPSIGYAVDFSNIAHSDSLSFNSTYCQPDVDTLGINARIVNPDNHTLTATAQIVSEDTTIVDSTDLTDNGDGIWSGKWPVPEGERTYRVGIKTIDEESGMIHNGLLWNVEKFTTLGPIKYESYIGERGGFGNSQYELSLFLHNESNTTTAEGVSATLVLISEDTCYSYMAIPTCEFDAIAPGQTGESTDKYIVQLEGVCRNNNILLTFRVDIAMDGYVFGQDTLMVDIPTNLEEFDENLPRKFALKQNYPNPFNPKTIINYELPTTITVELSIYNLLGQKVVTLVSEKQRAGYHQVEWDASRFASGIYYYKVEAGEFREVKKMILLR